ncbi:MAG: hypothetical protein FWF26_05770, partial [Treponema sp.]|nr:hypothetical protein [Treponema sp.]
MKKVKFLCTKAYNNDIIVYSAACFLFRIVKNNLVIYSRLALFFILSFFLFSCAITKAIYLGNNDYIQRTDSAFQDRRYNTEDINGIFPGAVYIKTRTQTFNSYYYFILRGGLIWYKSIDPENEPKEWTLFTDTGLPHNIYEFGFKKTDSIREISADADELVALSAEGNFYRYCFDLMLGRMNNVWFDRQGWPDNEQLSLDERCSKNRSWALGKRNNHVLYYEDPFGNQHNNGIMEIATTYVLLEDGQEICFSDTGLPSDFSHNLVGPERGTFKATSLSASASTLFVINNAGEMYTRLADFDTVGSDPIWFKYSYAPYKSDLAGTDYFSNLSEWGLPGEDWRAQPRIPLAGKAVISRYITILQNGQGNSARELRVAGMDETGKSGYWYKQIFDDSWKFEAAPLYFTGDAVLVTASGYDANAKGERGPSMDKNYSGYWWNGVKREDGYEYRIPNFNILEGDCDLRITWQDETCTLKLHPVEMWTYNKRDYLPGRTGSPKMFLVTLEIPDNAFESLSGDFAKQLAEKFTKYDKVLFQYTIAASDRFIIMRDSDDTDSTLFLTDSTISDQYPEFYPSRYIENFGEIRRYYSPELSVKNNPDLSLDDLAEKIALNRQYINELKYKIRVLKWSEITAFKFNVGYVPAHYIVRLTPLRFIDVPKLHTITNYGERLILANSQYINMIGDIRIWMYERLIELSEIRLQCYTDMHKKLFDLSKKAAHPKKDFIPPWYSENISDYWDYAGLPRDIQGAFF